MPGFARHIAFGYLFLMLALLAAHEAVGWAREVIHARRAR